MADQTRFDIREFGARRGETATESIQKAIDEAHAASGGEVIVPAGHWFSANLFLKSGVTLNVAPGAILEANPDLSLYREMSMGHNKDRQPYHFLIIEDQENVTVTGGGILDGNGMAHWDAPRGSSPWYSEKDKRISPFVECRNSRRIVFENITLRNSPGWTLHLESCDDVILKNVRVENHLYGPNTDGFDINGCRDVLVSGCKLVCGDDAIIIKATSDSRTCERITVADCIVRSNCIGIGIGCETAGGVRQVAISNCVAFHCHRMFAIGMWEGGFVEDIVVTGIVGDTLESAPLARPIHLDVKQHAREEGTSIGRLRNVQISNFVARTEGRILMTCQNGGTLENVTLRDVRLDITRVEDPDPISPPDGKTGSTQYSNFNLEARKQRAALVVENARDLVVDGLHISWPEDQEKDITFRSIWARNVKGGYIHAPLAKGWGSADESGHFEGCRLEPGRV